MQGPTKQVPECQILLIVHCALLERSSLDLDKQKKLIAPCVKKVHLLQDTVLSASEIAVCVELEHFKPGLACRQLQTALCARRERIRRAEE